MIALKGKARKHQKLLHFRILFFWRKKVTYHCSAVNCDEKVLLFCALHTLLLLPRVKSWKWRVERNKSRKAVIREIQCPHFFRSEYFRRSLRKCNWNFSNSLKKDSIISHSISMFSLLIACMHYFLESLILGFLSVC